MTPAHLRRFGAPVHNPSVSAGRSLPCARGAAGDEEPMHVGQDAGLEQGAPRSVILSHTQLKLLSLP